jgi:hypothetical protein
VNSKEENSQLRQRIRPLDTATPMFHSVKVKSYNPDTITEDFRKMFFGPHSET